jgi:uncharacterized protein (DUF1778 family)
MTTHTRTYLQVQAHDAVTNALDNPTHPYGTKGLRANVVATHQGRLWLRMADNTHCEFTLAQRAELEAQLVDDWQLEQGDYDDKENGTMTKTKQEVSEPRPSLAAALARIAEESPALTEIAKAYINGDENRTELQRYRVSKAEQVRIQRAAQAAGVTASEFVRAAVLARLDNGEVRE